MVMRESAETALETVMPCKQSTIAIRNRMGIRNVPKNILLLPPLSGNPLGACRRLEAGQCWS